MMIGELRRPHPTVKVPPWDPYDDPTAGVYSPYSVPSPTAYLAALRRYQPSNELDQIEPETEFLDELLHDEFYMYVFKVRPCTRGRSHDWTTCPYAHPGEKARRRDPHRFQYSGTPCPDLRKGVCKRGDSCEFAHGVFECWLHPDRYRTQPCKDGSSCPRRVCFFAHTPDQLRILPQPASPAGSVDLNYSSMGRHGFFSSPSSILSSPPISPISSSPPVSPSGLNHPMSELVASMRGLSFGKTKLRPKACWPLRPHMNSIIPSTPTQSQLGGFHLWESPFEEEPAMERVESGRDIRAQMYAKLSKNNSLDQVDLPGSGPDLGWVAELVK
ncbi:hypothetical protein SAY86_007644 [Trapa natans]|uniref:C3H1-type domain-containing protein n=1 Tax=Trapa natans TaxID=22666 RepID=A0AAN7LDU3_TRANT|nr:hypothetical protein SAY86_007644 [Trapa natans]